jgi:hypothetical protein
VTLLPLFEFIVFNPRFQFTGIESMAVPRLSKYWCDVEWVGLAASTGSVCWCAVKSMNGSPKSVGFKGTYSNQSTVEVDGKTSASLFLLTITIIETWLHPGNCNHRSNTANRHQTASTTTSSPHRPNRPQSLLQRNPLVGVIQPTTHRNRSTTRHPPLLVSPVVINNTRISPIA